MKNKEELSVRQPKYYLKNAINRCITRTHPEERKPNTTSKKRNI